MPTLDLRKLRDEARALAAANPDPSRWIQLSQAQYDALRVSGARFVKNTPNVRRNTITKAISYEERTFFVVIPL